VQHLLDQHVGFRARLESLLRVHADDRIEQRSSPLLRTSASSMSGLPLDRIASLRSFIADSAARASGIEIEMQIFVDDAREAVVVIFEPEAAKRVGQRVARHFGEIPVVPHQRAQPGIFELLDAPDLGDDSP
jgi:hypothetical protein